MKKHKKMNRLESLMSLTKGTTICCGNNSNEKEGVELNTLYCFECYDSSQIPMNNYQACMSWYPNKPIWTPEEYEEIRFKFMRVKLEGIEKLQWLKDFDMYELID